MPKLKVVNRFARRLSAQSLAAMAEAERVSRDPNVKG